jgi:hypothetical protein
MQQLTGADSHQLWIGETGWSEPAPEDFTNQVANCPAWASRETFQRYYGDFLSWDLSIGYGARAPEHVFYFSMRDSWNFGKREGFGLIEGCNALTCKIHSEGYNPVTFEYVADAPSDNFCQDGLLAEFYPDTPEHGHDECDARCRVDPSCQYFSYWESNWCRLTSSCASFGHAPGNAILIFHKRGGDADSDSASGGVADTTAEEPEHEKPSHGTHAIVNMFLCLLLAVIVLLTALWCIFLRPGSTGSSAKRSAAGPGAGAAPPEEASEADVEMGLPPRPSGDPSGPTEPSVGNAVDDEVQQSSEPREATAADAAPDAAGPPQPPVESAADAAPSSPPRRYSASAALRLGASGVPLRVEL